MVSGRPGSPVRILWRSVRPASTTGPSRKAAVSGRSARGKQESPLGRSSSTVSSCQRRRRQSQPFSTAASCFWPLTRQTGAPFSHQGARRRRVNSCPRALTSNRKDQKFGRCARGSFSSPNFRKGPLTSAARWRRATGCPPKTVSRSEGIYWATVRESSPP